MTAFALVAAMVLTACSDSDETAPEPEPSGQSKSPTKDELTLGVWGNTFEVAAFEDTVKRYNDASKGVHITVESWPDRESMNQALAAGERRPDVFMLARGDLLRTIEEKANTPVLELLDERGVDYGDGYSRDALLAFSNDDELQCVPYGISPMVMYYNPKLVDFDRMAARDLPVPTLEEDTWTDTWTYEQFTAAAEFASRPRKGTKGVHVDRSLRALAPFVVSGGGELFDSGEDPTSTDLSSEGSRNALTEAMTVLRDPRVTLSDQQLAKKPALQWFKEGKLGMIAGFRDLTPELRQVSGLAFDVLPMPKIDDDATVGDMTGMCISSKARSIPKAADFLVDLVSDESVREVARQGYLVPANLNVALSEDFLQPEKQPAHAQVFNTSMSDMVLLPLLEDYPKLEEAVRPGLEQLFTTPIADLESITEQIDQESRTVLAPVESGSPSPGEDDSSSESADTEESLSPEPTGSG